MSTSPSPGATAPPPMQPYERTAAALCHLSTIIPGYALVANGLLYFAYRESSPDRLLSRAAGNQLPDHVSPRNHRMGLRSSVYSTDRNDWRSWLSS